MKRGFIWLSILADADSKMVLTFPIADESVGESPRLPTLLDEALEKLGMPGRVGTSRVVVALIGDKADDVRENFLYCGKRGIAALTPVKANANCRAGGIDRARTEAVLDQLPCACPAAAITWSTAVLWQIPAQNVVPDEKVAHSIGLNYGVRGLATSASAGRRRNKNGKASHMVV